MKKFKKGDKVYWTDPDDGLGSGEGRISSISGEIFLIEKNDGGEVEALIHELKKLSTK